MLSENEVLSYVELAKKGDKTAKEILYKNNTPLVKSIIRRFKNKGIEYEDLFQIGSLGFLKAIINFDASFGVKFSTYAVPMIVGEVKRYIRDNGTIKVSRNIKILSSKINRFIDELKTIENDISKKKYYKERHFHYDLRAYNDLRPDDSGKNVSTYDICLSKSTTLLANYFLTTTSDE
jgi:RNA polymerase sigma factor (sigma-70 family)